MDPLELVQLRPLMARSEGRPEVAVGLIDGPVTLGHPALADAIIREVPGGVGASCLRAESAACTHATFVAGMLVARRGSQAPAICPGCTLLVRPIFAESTNGNHQMPSADPKGLAEALIDSVDAGARVINLSAALVHSASKGERQLERALDYSARRGVIVVAAAGNQASVGSSAITRHPWVIPVVGCDLEGRPTKESNLGRSIGGRGLRAPGENITSLGTNGKPQTFGGTSAAAPFVTGAIALLWSEFPTATAGEVKLAVTRSSGWSRTRLVPPLLDAWAARQAMVSAGWRPG
ncbi:MAG: S8 family serine peptidase [Terriglobia bacterium]